MNDLTQHATSSETVDSLIPQGRQQQPLGEEFSDLAPGLVMSTFRSSRLWGGVAWRRAFAGRADQSAPARRMVGQLLADTGRADDAQWVTAELVSNALRHTRSGQAQGFFVMEVLWGAAVARIVVHDLGGDCVPDFSRMPGSVPEEAEHGRGLLGVAELAIRVGAAGDASTGHAVWADLALTSETACAPRRADVVHRGPAVEAAARAGQVQEAAAVREMEPGDAAPSHLAIRATACCDGAPLGEEAAGETGPLFGRPARRLDGFREQTWLGQREGGRRPGPSLRLVGGKTDQASAFGQEPWAQQALAALRRDWPDWAFLVVRYQWLGMRGKQVLISATGPDELRQALSSDEPFEHLPMPNVSLSPGADAGGACSGDAGAGLSGTLTAVGPPSGVLGAERSGTGTWRLLPLARCGWIGGRTGG
ncbi:ATP-binding protein [Nonomuraea pusilla]|nr:ATP-binding protein [Nonomuraea pusilla]